MKEKFFTKDFVFWLLCFLLIIVSKFFLPKSGGLVLLDEGAEVLLILIVSIYLVFKLVKNKNSVTSKKKYEDWLIIIFLILLNVFFSRNLILDVVNGPKRMVLYNVSVSKYQKRLGFNYYLEGDDSLGDNHNFKISIDEVNRINSLGYGRRTKVTVVYYEYTDRVVDILY